MGRKTFDSIGRPLPKRTNIVLTRDPFYLAAGVQVARTIPEALAIAQAEAPTEIFIIGGGEIYARSWEHIDRLYVTEVNLLVEEGDAFFPEIDPVQWREISREEKTADARNEVDYTFVVWERIPSFPKPLTDTTPE